MMNPFEMMKHCKASDEMGAMGKENLTAEKDLRGNTKQKWIFKNNVLVTLRPRKEEDVKIIDSFIQLPVNAHKLLCYGQIVFTRRQSNITPLIAHGKKIWECSFNFTVEEYIRLCGYEGEIDKSVYEEGRRNLKEDLDFLLCTYFTWKERRGKKFMDYDGINVLDSYKIRNKHAQLTFTQSYAGILMECPLTQFPMSLLRIDSRNPNAYGVAYAMALHYNKDTTQLAGNAQILKVKNLLKKTNLPGIDEETVKEHSWIDRIKEPFEACLNYLVGTEHFLTEWHYSEEYNYNYFDWIETPVHFTFKEVLDHSERLEKKALQKPKKR